MAHVELAMEGNRLVVDGAEVSRVSPTPDPSPGDVGHCRYHALRANQRLLNANLFGGNRSALVAPVTKLSFGGPECPQPNADRQQGDKATVSLASGLYVFGRRQGSLAAHKLSDGPRYLTPREHSTQASHSSAAFTDVTERDTM